jgi:Ca2+-binding EF-hand superfamily protein
MKATRLLIAGTAAALLPFAGAFAQSSTPDQGAPPSQPSQQGATFESLDTNSDGRISKDEAAANANVSQQFSKYDQNGDGFIERSEVTSANSAPPKDPQ